MRILRSLHAWVGALLALFLVVQGLSGVLAVLRGEMIVASVPAARAAKPPPDSLGPALEVFDAARAGHIKAVLFSPHGLGVHRVYLADGASSFIDGQGREVQRWRGNRRIEELVLSLHRELLFGKAGNLMVGVAGIAGLGLVAAGLLIWAVPRPRLDARIWPATAARRDVYRAHQNLGALLGLFLVVQLTTALVMAYGGAARTVLGVDGPRAPRAAPFAGPVPWTAILNAALIRVPNGEIRRVIAPARAHDPFVINLHAPGEWRWEAETVVFVDGRGSVLGVSRSTDRTLGTRVYAGLKALHTGDYGGDLGRLGAGLVGLGMAVLGGFGLWSFVRGPRVRAAIRVGLTR